MLIRCHRYFCAYFFAIVIMFTATQKKTHILRVMYWFYDQYPILHRWGFSKSWGANLISRITQMKRKTVCVLVKSDEVCFVFLGFVPFPFLIMVLDKSDLSVYPICEE